ncbi:hypothetical protein IFM89_029219 [Coptis chinensis]|uniref:Cytochrome P450 n=1 Tax=Coptis chinensis TaxID=261450 RepID=A0A835MCG3_9MAGN|nr:hypothetical protein IFM89_029219 [Coptis chinensis]
MFTVYLTSTNKPTPSLTYSKQPKFSRGGKYGKIVALVLVIFFLSKKVLHIKHHPKNLPPSPRSLPVIGHFHLLGKPIHIAVDSLLRQYGQILFLWFGSRPVLVLCSPTAIKECFTRKDIIFASRPRLILGEILSKYSAIPMAPYGDLWRNLRRFTASEIFSTNCLDISSSIRREEVWSVIRGMCKSCDGEFENVELNSIFKKLIFNILMRILGMKPCFGEEEMVDPEKAEDKLDELSSRFFPKQVVLNAGTETSTTTMEWAMSFLLNHPEVLNKARNEIDSIVGYDRLLNESDFGKLPYLHSIISETLRLRPIGPFIPPHESMEDCTIGGFDIPKGTMLLVNQLALHSDPNVWPEPMKFKPDRFEKGNGENGVNWIAFGLGRRACPGEGLALRMLGLTLGVLIQFFDWERIGGDMVDMSVREQGIRAKAKPLEAMYRPRKSLLHLLSHL